MDAASLLENVRFNALVIVPNAIQGVFRRRRRRVAAATAANIDGHAVGLLRAMRDRHEGGPVWVRVIREPALLVLEPDDVRRVLEGAPEPFASDPKPKRDGLVTFQPDALTISRGETWRNRRAFNEAVLCTGWHWHQLAGPFVDIAAQEVSALAPEGEIGWDGWSAAFRRIARRLVLGEQAANDTEISETLAEMMSEANGMPGEPSERYPAFTARLGEYTQNAEPGSLLARFAEAPVDADTKPVGQIAHWMFATGDTLAINSLRALALLASHPRQRALAREELTSALDKPFDVAVGQLRYLDACLEEAMRLWPTTTMLVRETVADTEWGGETVPAGTQVLIPNVFFHRDTTRHEWADRFAPERWGSGGASDDWSFNHFSHGPQGCPGSDLAMLLGKAALASVLRTGELTLEAPSLDATKPLPKMLDFFGIRVSVEPGR